MSGCQIERSTITARDGHLVNTCVYTPFNAPSGYVIIINSTLGVWQSFYKEFAVFITSYGHVVMTFDYRGIGKTDHSGSKKNMMKHWGIYDVSAVISNARKRFPKLPIMMIGHGIGGQIIGLSPNTNQLENVVLINSSHPYIFYSSPISMIIKWLLSNILIPFWQGGLRILSSMLWDRNYMLSETILLEWRKWMRSEQGLFELYPSNFYRHLDIPFLILWAKDDRWTSSNGIRQLMKKYYPSVKSYWHFLDPKKGSLHKIGHKDFFREENACLWHLIHDWGQQHIYGLSGRLMSQSSRN